MLRVHTVLCGMLPRILAALTIASLCLASPFRRCKASSSLSSSPAKQCTFAIATRCNAHRSAAHQLRGDLRLASGCTAPSRRATMSCSVTRKTLLMRVA